MDTELTELRARVGRLHAQLNAKDNEITQLTAELDNANKLIWGFNEALSTITEDNAELLDDPPKNGYEFWAILKKIIKANAAHLSGHKNAEALGELKAELASVKALSEERRVILEKLEFCVPDNSYSVCPVCRSIYHAPNCNLDRLIKADR